MVETKLGLPLVTFYFFTFVTFVTLICHKSRIEDLSMLDYAGGSLAHHAASQASGKISRLETLRKELKEIQGKSRTGSSDNVLCGGSLVLCVLVSC